MAGDVTGSVLEMNQNAKVTDILDMEQELETVETLNKQADECSQQIRRGS